MKKLFAILLALLLAVCPALAEDSAEADWSAYDALVDSIKAENDPAAREALMHEAEAMLMDTGAVVPITYYTDPYMMKTGVEGVYGTIEGFKYFMYATYDEADTLRINLASEPDRLDPALLYTVDGACLAVNSFAGLYTHAADGTLQPELATGCTCPPEFPVCVCGKKPKLKLVTRKPTVAGEEELEENPRARSAKLRVAERTEY